MLASLRTLLQVSAICQLLFAEIRGESANAFGLAFTFSPAEGLEILQPQSYDIQALKNAQILVTLWP
jgi:hypothetical protein